MTTLDDAQQRYGIGRAEGTLSHLTQYRAKKDWKDAESKETGVIA